MGDRSFAVWGLWRAIGAGVLEVEFPLLDVERPYEVSVEIADVFLLLSKHKGQKLSVVREVDENCFVRSLNPPFISFSCH